MSDYKMKRIIGTFMTAMITLGMLGLTGCGGGSQNSSSEIEKKEINYLYQNNISYKLVEMEDFSDAPPEEYLYTRIEIDGLADAAVEQKINDKISEVFEEMTDRKGAGYRGFSSVVNSSAAKSSETISMRVTGNYNNILSILVLKNVDQGGTRYSDNETLNFDLRTGETVGIHDLFEDGNCDELNQYIANHIKVFGNVYAGGEIYDETADYHMISVFKGVPEDQKYFMNEYGLVMLFDYTNPEFYFTDFNALEIQAGYDVLAQSLALDKFLEVQENADIYEKHADRIMMVYGSAETVEKKDSSSGNGGVRYSGSFSYTKDIPEEAISCGNELVKFSNDLVAGIKESGAASGSCTLTNKVKGNHVGAYYNIVRDLSGFWGNAWEQSMDAYVFDMEGNSVSLDDFFTDGYDYMSVIKSELQSYLNNGDPDSSVDEAGISKISENISFYVDIYGLKILTEPVEKSGSGGKTYRASIVFEIPYEKFGTENIKL